MIIKSQSSVLSRNIYGNNFKDIWTPWYVTLDLKNNTLEVLKKNWYLIGIDRQIIPFKNIRKFDIDEHLFGCDIQIKIYGGLIKAKCLKKRSANQIRNQVLIKISSLKSKSF
jgi:hypothetical protein